jgi:hypothetical protein
VRYGSYLDDGRRSAAATTADLPANNPGTARLLEAENVSSEHGGEAPVFI